MILEYFTEIDTAMNFEIPEDRFHIPQSPIDVAETSAEQLFTEAFDHPLDYPKINQIVFPGDAVAFVFSNDVRDLEATITALVKALKDILRGVKIEIVTLGELNWDPQRQQDFLEKASQSDLQIGFTVHDPEQSSELAYIAVNRDGEPVHINRAIFNADVVVPVGNNKLDLYPEYSNINTIDRFKDNSLSGAEQRAEIRLVNEAVGIHFAIQVKNQVGQNISAVTCGTLSGLVDQHKSKQNSSLQVEKLHDAKVILATIEEKGQTWGDFFKALANAHSASMNSEKIIICTELDELPGSTETEFLQLQFESDQDKVRSVLASAPEHIKKVPSILQNNSVFLYSRLEESDVEELGLGYIESTNQIQRVIDRADTGAFLRDAHLCQILEPEKSS